MRGTDRGRRKKKNKTRGSRWRRALGGLCLGLSLLSISIIVSAGAAWAQQTAPSGAPAIGSAPGGGLGGGVGGGIGGFSSGVGGVGSFAPAPGAFTSPLGAYGAAPLAAPPPTAPAAAEGFVPEAVPPAWLLVPSIELGEAFNDNVNLAPKGSRLSDFITTVTPGLNLTGHTARLNLALNYDPQELIFARGTSSPVLQQRLLGTGTAELLRETLFVDGSTSINQVFVRSTGPIAPTTLTTNGNLQTAYTENVSPYVRQHLGSYADSESRYVFSSVTTSGGGIAGEQTNELRQTFLGGEFFGRLGWQAIGDWTKLTRDQDAADPFSGTSAKDQLLRTDLKYPVYQALSMIGSIGYERITDPSLTKQPKGVIWSTGFTYQPNQLVSGTITYGQRFDQTDIEFNATYNLDPQLRLSAVYTQTIQTGQSILAGNLQNSANGVTTPGTTPGSTTPGTTTGPTTPPTTFIPIPGSGSTASSLLGLTSGAFLLKTAELDAVLTKARDTYGATIYESKRTGNTTTVLGPLAGNTVSGERIFGATATWTHLLRPDLTANASGTYYRALFLDGSGRHDNAYTLALGLTYTLSRTATATLSLSRYDLRSNIAADSLVDDIVLATVRKEF
jgi:uncharacterized protein (PEP-CTERM system associated)